VSCCQGLWPWRALPGSRAKILSLVPAAFGLFPDAREVELRISGLRPVVFQRPEFLEAEPDDSPHKLPMLGFTTAKWLLDSGSSWTERDQATYITFPLTMLHFASCRLAGSTPPRTENIDQAIYSLQAALSRLDEVLPAGHRSTLTSRATDLLTSMTASLRALAESRRGHRTSEGATRAAHHVAATLEPMHEIQEAAKGLRDSDPQSSTLALRARAMHRGA